MSIHLQRRIEKIKKMILSVGGLVEEALGEAIRSVDERDPDLAARVIESDQRVDAMEIEVEDECLSALALDQPVAFDLRYVVAVMKMNNDLERIGDLAVNIAEQATFLSSEEALATMPFDFTGMSQVVQWMLKHSLDALVNVDVKLAESVRISDDKVDAIYRQLFAKIEGCIRDEPHHLEQYIHVLNIARQLERIADHAVNIAEDVIYLAKGEIYRHRGKQQVPPDTRLA